MRGTDVIDLQTCLNIKTPTLPALLVPDGIFGPKTKQAVMLFQKANNIKIDGIVGPITRGLLTK
jgi:peptidoglycan hydrolase-like protein with peptidoglycan-binding domain